jgi:hypothetical protein
LENRIPAMLIDHPAVVAFQSSDASFLVTDPRMPGNPIIYASDVSTISLSLSVCVCVVLLLMMILHFRSDQIRIFPMRSFTMTLTRYNDFVFRIYVHRHS